MAPLTRRPSFLGAPSTRCLIRLTPRSARIEGCSGHRVSDATGAASRAGTEGPGIGNAGSHTGRRLVGCWLSHPVCSAKRPRRGRSALCASHPGFDKSANIEGASAGWVPNHVEAASILLITRQAVNVSQREGSFFCPNSQSFHAVQIDSSVKRPC